MKGKTLRTWRDIDSNIDSEFIESSNVSMTGSLKRFNKTALNRTDHKAIDHFMNMEVYCYEYKLYRGPDSYRVKFNLGSTDHKHNFEAWVNTGSMSLKTATAIINQIINEE